ncbi:PREDICTED: SET and MYND domain-containing protein 4-like [Ceratosolen solmsi marchali]|uniref:SET and MYND domain-containing protein 4-like n=1 Tax=Ceratosolen solmsi marchali TaxID=326594 RepID=A0AAJ7E098_9HYME|nr:PREDICTED: SET and MYND domain-containing protein 4-like [Ceratosolen solmsi marchali]
MYFEEDLMSEQLLNLDFNEFITKINTKYIGKNSKISTKVRQKGNQLYIRKSHNAEIHKEIFNLYSMSVTFAIDASEELALAYGNRSAFLLHLGKYKESLEDLDKALNITMSNILKVKLYCRRVECLILLGLSDILDCNKVNVVSKKEDKKNPLIEKLLEKEKDIFSNIDINYSEKYGRYLVTTKEYKPGQIIYVETPYVACSNNKNPYIYCCHCLAIAWAGIPCKYCNWCIFCSVKCRVEAWKTYHNIECSVFPYIKKFSKNFVQSFQLSVKVMLMGMKEFDTIDKFKSEIEYIDKYNDKRTKGFLNDEVFVNTKFRSIYSLSNNISKQQFKTNVQNTAIALACIIKYTSFFKFNFVTNQELKSLIKNSEVVFIGTLLLKLINITCNNRHIIFNSLQACNKNSQPLRCAIAQCCSKGICLAPVSSLINNSCIPNVKRCFTEDHKIIIYAVETIPQNSQVNIK